MSRWMRWGLAAAMALALTPAARADDTHKSKMEQKADETKADAKQGYGEAKAEAKEEAGQAKSEAKEAGQDVRAGMERTGDKAKQTGTAADKASRHDNTDVIRKLYTANILEVETAKIAKDKSQDERNKQFAETLEKDHSSLGDKLKELAKNRNAELDDDKALETHRAHIDKMKNMDAQTFDSHFKEMMVSEHGKMEKDVKSALDRAKKSGDNELASLLQSAHAKIKEHHHLAMDLGKDKGQRAGRRAAERGGSMERGTAPSGTGASGGSRTPSDTGTGTGGASGSTGTSGSMGGPSGTSGQSGTGTIEQGGTSTRGDSGQTQTPPSASPTDRGTSR